MEYDTLKKDDYLEPDCLLTGRPGEMKQPKQFIPQKRISQKVDELMSQKDPEGAERMLDYWLEEARVLDDQHGRFFIYNEKMGLFRKVGNREKAYEAIKNALTYLEVLGYEDAISGGTCYVNAGTVCSEFRDYEQSLQYFEKAAIIYEKHLAEDDYRMGGLYNNMAVTLAALGRFSEAYDYYDRAMEVMKKNENGQLEQAMTKLNIIDALTAEGRLSEMELDERVNQLLEEARELLDSESLPHDGYYAFVCDKCLGAYEHYGWFRYVRTLKERIREIDERA